MGMTYEQYWDGEVSAHRAYRKAKELRISEQNRMAWLQGIYVYEAIADLAPYLKAFSKSKPKPYSSEPYDLFEHERQARREREERERIFLKFLRIHAEVYPSYYRDPYPNKPLTLGG